MYARLGANNLTPDGHHGAMGIIEPISCASRKRGDVHKLEMRKDDVANRLTSIDADSMIVEPQVLTPLRTEEGRRLRKQGIDDFANRELVPREDGCSNTITSVQKDNLLAEPTFLRAACGFGKPAEQNFPSAITSSAYVANNFIKEPITKCLNYYDENGEKRHQQNGIYSEDGIANLLNEGIWEHNGTYYKVRALTPRELFRLMDVSEEDIDKIQNAGISKTAQCVLAGNSIVVSCIYWLLYKLFVNTGCEEQQLSLF